MTYKTHISAGLLFSSVIFLSILKTELTPILLTILFFSTILGASVPDLDTPTGGLWHKIPAGGLISRLVHPIFIGGHRHLSHSVLGMGLFTLLFWLFVNFLLAHNLPIPVFEATIAFIAGYCSHLFADMFTEAGVPLLFPLGYHFGIPPDPFGKLRIKTGHWFENMVVYPGINILLIYLVWHSIIK